MWANCRAIQQQNYVTNNDVKNRRPWFTSQRNRYSVISNVNLKRREKLTAPASPGAVGLSLAEL